MDMPNPIVELNNIAGFMISDSDLWVTGRYDRLHLINILALQQQMSELERDIDDVIKYERRQVKEQGGHMPIKTSDVILAKLRETVKAYDDAIVSLANLRKTEIPADHIVQGLRNFANAQLCPSLVTSLHPISTQRHATSHLLTIGSSPGSWLHRYVGRHERLSRAFKEQRGGDGLYFSKFSETKLRNTEFALVAAFLCLIQLLPVLALTLVSHKSARLAIIIILILLVSILNTLFADTVRATNFGAIAAYSAIVVVFVSQDN